MVSQALKRNNSKTFAFDSSPHKCDSPTPIRRSPSNRRGGNRGKLRRNRLSSAAACRRSPRSNHLIRNLYQVLFLFARIIVRDFFFVNSYFRIFTLCTNKLPSKKLGFIIFYRLCAFARALFLYLRSPVTSLRTDISGGTACSGFSP